MENTHTENVESNTMLENKKEIFFADRINKLMYCNIADPYFDVLLEFQKLM